MLDQLPREINCVVRGYAEVDHMAIQMATGLERAVHVTNVHNKVVAKVKDGRNGLKERTNCRGRIRRWQLVATEL